MVKPQDDPSPPLEISSMVVGPLSTNCYVIASGRKAAVVDPGGEPELIVSFLNSKDLQVESVIATHSHFDHVIAAKALCDLYNAPFMMHEAEKTVLDLSLNLGRELFGIPEIDLPETRYLHGQEKIPLGDAQLEIMETPGHTPGSISIIAGDSVLTGDTLFRGSIGRTDLGGDWNSMIQSLGKLLKLPGHLRVLPGHGPESTVELEKTTNPFAREL